MANIAFSDVRIKTLKPRKSAFDIRDATLRGFGVRVLPSGAKRFFIHAQHRGERVWKVVGDANAMDVAEARTRAWVFPAQGANQPRGRHWLDRLRQQVRADADLSDVRLHDLRHYSRIRLIPVSE